MTFRVSSMGLWTIALLLLMNSSESFAQRPHRRGPFWDGVFPSQRPDPRSGWKLENAFGNLTFVDPLAAVTVPRGEEQVFVVGKPGYVHAVRKDVNRGYRSEKILDISERVQVGSDTGLMGLAFHPNFGLQGRSGSNLIFLSYQYSPSPIGGASGTGSEAISYFRLSRFTYDFKARRIDPTSELVLIQQFDRNLWHSAGALEFGKDGMLYMTTGDEGGAFNQFGNGQRLDRYLFGGVLRIDVDMDSTRSHPIRRQPMDHEQRPTGWPPSFTANYFIPNDNPWLDPNGGLLEEFFALGLRNPHSLHIDPETQELWIGDIGQGSFEELDRVTKGDNLQWPFREGFNPGYGERPAQLIGREVPPVIAYGRNVGTSIIGGPRYRGGALQSLLRGKVLYGDHLSRKLWALDLSNPSAPQSELLATFAPGSSAMGIAGMNLGRYGQVYLPAISRGGEDGGIVYRLIDTPPVPDPPSRLSQTGLYDDLSKLSLAEGLQAYDINVPFWSDGAVKHRAIALPRSTSGSEDPTIAFSASASWDFPVGSVFVKTFTLGSNTSAKKIETRVLVKARDGGVYGVTYKWLPDGSDAILLNRATSEKISWLDSSGAPREQMWSYPGRDDCLSCHTAATKGVLGINTQQMNHIAEGENELLRWHSLGMLSSSFEPGKLPSLVKSAPLSDAAASLEHKVRSYLDSNCSFCHHPQGVGTAFDARITTPLLQQNIINGPIFSREAIKGERIIKPSQPEKSLLLSRLEALGNTAMPPLAKHIVDAEAVDVFKKWISTLNPDHFPERSYRFVKVVALSEVNNGPWTSIAELRFVDKDLGQINYQSTRAIEVDSDEEDSLASFAVDGDPYTMWHSAWRWGARVHPHHITVDLGKPYNLGLMLYLPRQGEPTNGRIARYEVYGSNNSREWDRLSVGTFKNSDQWQSAALMPSRKNMGR